MDPCNHIPGGAGQYPQPQSYNMDAQSSSLNLTDVLPLGILAFLDIKSACSLRASCSQIRLDLQTAHACADSLALSKAHTIGSMGHKSILCLKDFGRGILSLSLHKSPLIDSDSFSTLLSLCPNLRKLAVHDVDWLNWDDTKASQSVARLGQLQELRLQCSELNGDRNPFSVLVREALPTLQHLRKLTLFCRLSPSAIESLANWLSDNGNNGNGVSNGNHGNGVSRRLQKLKLSASLINGDRELGSRVLAAVGTHSGLEKLTIARPEGMGEPLRSHSCSLISKALTNSGSLWSIHIRRCALTYDTLSNLTPSVVCPRVKSLKLDSNSLGYAAGKRITEALDTLLSRFPNLAALHLGNNQLDAPQTEGLAASIAVHKLVHLENLTLGSNDIGDSGLLAVMKVLPTGMRQLYLHGIECSDVGVAAIRSALDRMPYLWGLGLNGNPISDSGARTLARALRCRPALRDVGITLSEMTDKGCDRLSTALQSCPNLRYVYLYSTGFKSAQKVSEQAKARLRDDLPQFATAAFDHRLSRYLKKP